MSTAAAEPDAVAAPNEPSPASWDAPAADAWKAAVEATPQPEPVAEPKKEEKKPEGDKPADSIPDDLIATPEPKKEEEDPDEAIINQKPSGQLKHEQFQALQEASKRRIEKVKAEYEAKLKADVEAAVKSAPKPEANPEEIKALREALEKKEEIISRYSVENSERFQNEFVRKEKGYRDQASTYVKEAGGDVNAIESAFRLGGKKGADAIAAMDLDPHHTSYLIGVLAKHDEIQGAKTATLERHRELSKQWAEEAKQAHEAQVQKQRENEAQVFELVSKEIAAKYPLIFNKRENNEAWNARLEADGGRAFTAFKAEMDVNDYAAHQVKGAALDRAYEALVRQKDTIDSLQKELRELKSAGPNINGTKPPENKPEKRDAYDPQALEKAAAQGWAAAVRGG